MEELLRMWRGREFQVVGAATAKPPEPKHVDGHVGQPTNYSPMNEVYEMERIVSIQSPQMDGRSSITLLTGLGVE